MFIGTMNMILSPFGNLNHNYNLKMEFVHFFFLFSKAKFDVFINLYLTYNEVNILKQVH